jgi:LysR family transcriptional activator of glutamate synthase operon
MTYELAGLANPLEQLVAVARAASVTSAAAQLGVPQPTVSRTLARLSRELGTELLVPDGRGVRLTRQGRALAEHAGRALDELRSAVAAVRAESDADTGRVVLGFLHSMGPVAVPALLRGFRDAHPGVAIGLVQDSAENVLDAVLDGRVDLALASPVTASSTLKARSLARQPLVALLPEHHALAARRRLAVADLAGEPFVTMRPGYGVRTLTDDLLRTAGLPLRYALETDEMTTVAGLVAAGLGVSILPAGNGADGTVEIPLRDAGTARVISLAWSAQRRQSEPVAALRRHLIERGPVVLGATRAARSVRRRGRATVDRDPRGRLGRGPRAGRRPDRRDG